MPRYEWVLFDADGTLFDYDRAEGTALRKAFEEAGHPFEPRFIEAYREINGEIWLAFERGEISQERLRTKRFELLFEAVGVVSGAAEFSRSYLGHLARAADLIPGAEETVAALHGKVGLLLITNGLKEVQRSRLARSPVQPYFGGIVISEEVGASKPDTRIFDAAFARMDWPEKDSVLIVGDSLTSDMRGGNGYGIDTCWFNPSGKPRTEDVAIRYEIARLDEVLTIVRV